jgi:dipeptidyl aminopeptidase/acylaminoacyl peptidase
MVPLYPDQFSVAFIRKDVFMRHRWLAALLLVFLFGSFASPASAEYVEVNPNEDPITTLNEEEAKRYEILRKSTFTYLLSDISPDDQAIVEGYVLPNGEDIEVSLLDINSGTSTSILSLYTNYPPLSDMRWRNPTVLAYISIDFFTGPFRISPVLVNYDRASGGMWVEELNLSAAPISLSPDASKAIIARVHEADEDADFIVDNKFVSPFSKTIRRGFASPASNPWFDDGESQDIQVSEDEVELLAVDLASGQETSLITLPLNSGLLSAPAWSIDSAKVGFAHITLSNISRSGTELSDSSNQDTLGLLPREKNDFFQSNAVSVFDLNSGDLRPRVLEAKNGNGDIFTRVSWSTDGQTMLAQMAQPSHLAGRAHPTYLYPERSYLRFYNNAFEQIGSFDRAEINAPNLSAAQFVSPDEVMIVATHGLSDRLYYYNRVSGEFRQVSLWDGTYNQVFPTRLSRKLLFNFSSFQHAPDLYTISWEGTELNRLTWRSGEAESQNHVRADVVSFTMSNGATRSGYLIQPADAAFPPKNVPIVVWQEGGPGGSMGNSWGTHVEAPFNLLPNFGISVLVLPLPGREGHGPEFYRALSERENFGAIDIDEAAQAVRQMVSRGWTTPSKVGITGCSYGGYFTVQSITRHPDLYAAANAQCSLLDLFTEWELGYTPLLSYLEGAAPTTNAAAYLADSPIYNSSKIKTPLLLFAGTNDFLPSIISRNLHDQVATTDVPVKYLAFEGEGHGLSSPSSQTTAAHAQITWFREHLNKSVKMGLRFQP